MFFCPLKGIMSQFQIREWMLLRITKGPEDRCLGSDVAKQKIIYSKKH